MVPLTRRRLLQGAAGLVSGLAGCNGLVGTDESTHTSTPAAADTDVGPAGGRTSNPETFRLRVDIDRQPVWLVDDGQTSDRPSFQEGDRHLIHELIDGPDRADRLTIADVPNADRAASFLAATDFGSETIYLETYRVKECFELELCHIAWEPSHIETDYARMIRPYDVQCRVDERVIESWFIRIPDTLDADAVSSYAASVGAGSCRLDGARAEADGKGGSNTSRALDRPRARRDSGGSPDGGVR